MLQEESIGERRTGTLLPIPTVKLRQHGLLYACHQIHAKYAAILSQHAKPTLHWSAYNFVFKGAQLQDPWKLSPLLRQNLRSCRIDVRFDGAFMYKCQKHQTAINNHLEKFIPRVPKSRETFGIILTCCNGTNLWQVLTSPGCFQEALSYAVRTTPSL